MKTHGIKIKAGIERQILVNTTHIITVEDIGSSRRVNLQPDRTIYVNPKNGTSRPPTAGPRVNGGTRYGQAGAGQPHSRPPFLPPKQ